MAAIPVILIYDVGKTNKKVLLFDEDYKVVFEKSQPFEETKDEDGFPCEDVQQLTDWLKDSLAMVLADQRFEVKAINFSGYGASFVYLNAAGETILPLYNYLKPFPEALKHLFYSTYGGESLVAKQTASPVLGSLNSGMQLYRLKYEQPGNYEKIAHALHLPQYLSYVLGGGLHAEITSIGCHTNLWNFQDQQYHAWVNQEGLDHKFPPIRSSASVGKVIDDNIKVGVGLHDSSAALIPYLASFSEPFILLSTGTWCISLNPFNHSLLTDYELQHDCLCYISYQGNPVKASRLFAGYEHEEQVKRLAAHFNVAPDYYKTVKADAALIAKLVPRAGKMQNLKGEVMKGSSHFENRSLPDFTSYEEAYHYLIADIMEQQVISTSIVLRGTMVKRIFVDGGFSQNPIYMHLLSESFPDIEVFAAAVPQSSALGAALAIHNEWNSQSLPSEIIGLKLYSTMQQDQL